jgi:hypothetical protein
VNTSIVGIGVRGCIARLRVALKRSSMGRKWKVDASASLVPSDVTVAADERVVVIPRNLLVAAKPDIPDA